MLRYETTKIQFKLQHTGSIHSLAKSTCERKYSFFFFFSLFTFSSLCYNYVFFCLLEISVIHPAEYKLPSIREICICMLVYAYENEVLKIITNFFNVG